MEVLQSPWCSWYHLHLSISQTSTDPKEEERSNLIAFELGSNWRARGALLGFHWGLESFARLLLLAFFLRHSPDNPSRLLGSYPCLKNRFEGDPVNAEKLGYRRSQRETGLYLSNSQASSNSSISCLEALHDNSSVQHTVEECDLMSRLPVSRNERSKVTASVLKSGSKKVALKQLF